MSFACVSHFLHRQPLRCIVVFGHSVFETTVGGPRLPCAPCFRQESEREITSPWQRRLAEAVVEEYSSIGGFETGSSSVPGRAAAGRPTMPHYEFHCERCRRK